MSLRVATVAVHRVEAGECALWHWGDERIQHETGRYFSVSCVSAGGRERIMIDQPEIGILGFIIASVDGRRRWLIQDKPEPGNVGYYQLAPTVQATKSNYERVHGGAATPFLDLFIDGAGLEVDVINSEQGDRFLGKFNRNAKRVVSALPSLPDAPPHFTWLTPTQLKAQLRRNFAVNTDARSVIASGAWHLIASHGGIFLTDAHEIADAEAWFKSYHERSPDRLAFARSLINHQDMRLADRVGVPFAQMREHFLDRYGIRHREAGRAVGFFDVNLSDREVPAWQQPLLERTDPGRATLAYTVVDGVAMFNVAAYPEVGFVDRCELGPSLQTGIDPGKLERASYEERLSQVTLVAEIDQSDEGGRFYRSVTRYSLGRWSGDPRALNPDRGIWLTAGELELLSGSGGSLTNELRTLLSLLLSFA